MMGAVKTVGKGALKFLGPVSIPFSVAEMTKLGARLAGRKERTQDGRMEMESMLEQAALGAVYSKQSQLRELQGLEARHDLRRLSSELDTVLGSRDHEIAQATQGTRHSSIVTEMIRAGML